MPRATKRVVIHAGFHKTGTSSLQEALRQNDKKLGRDVAVLFKPQMRGLCEAARGYSVSRTPVDLGLVQYEAAVLAGELNAPLSLLSSEDLAGHMPGRLGLEDYAATPDIARAITGAFQAVDKKIELSFFFTLRAELPWLRSCHAQNVRASRMTLDQTAYIAQFAASGDLARIVKAVTAAVAPVPVRAETIEDWADDPLGTLRPLLDMADCATMGLRAMGVQNRTLPEETLDKLLILNRSDLEDYDLREAKRALLDNTP